MSSYTPLLNVCPKKVHPCQIIYQYLLPSINILAFQQILTYTFITVYAQLLDNVYTQILSNFICS